MIASFPLVALLVLRLMSSGASIDAPRTITVTPDGSGDFRTVQSAIDSLPEDGTAPVVIRLHPGIYKEAIRLGAHHPHLTLRGDGAEAMEKTVITFDRSARTLGPDGKPIGTSGSPSVTLEADDFTAEDITFENSAGPGTKVGQAVAVKVTGDRCIFRHCRFLGWQDTLYASAAAFPPNRTKEATDAKPPLVEKTAAPPNSSAMPGANRLCRQYFKDCYIEGSVDFIFGSARALFEHCELHSRAPGAVTAQARTESTQPGGYLFHDCDLTADDTVPSGSVLLGRPWRPYARVIYIDCRIGKHISPNGWSNWDDPAREKTAFYAEADCSGLGADRTNRVPWEHALTTTERAEFDTGRFLAGDDNWNPERVSR